MSMPVTAPRGVTVGGRIALVLAALFAVLDILVSASELGGNLIQPVALIVLGLLTLAAFRSPGVVRPGRCCCGRHPRAVGPDHPARLLQLRHQGVPQVVATVWIFVSILIAVLLLRVPVPSAE